MCLGITNKRCTIKLSNFMKDTKENLSKWKNILSLWIRRYYKIEISILH